jgi:hypothetical protein
MRVEISPSVETQLRNIAARSGMPSAESEKFEAAGPEGDNSYQITIWPHQMMVAMRLAYEAGFRAAY